MVGKTESRRLLVTYEAANGGPTSGVARDLALGGFFIETRQPLPVGSLVTVEVPSSASGSSPPIMLDARVISIRATRQGPDLPPGMNVAFLDLPDRVLMQLQYVFERHRPPERTRLGVGESEPPFSAPPPAPEELEEIVEVDDATARAAALAPAPLPIIEMPKAAAPPPAAMPPSPVAPAPAPMAAPPHAAFGARPAPFGAPPPSFGPAPPSSLGGLSTRVSIPDAAPRRNTALIVVLVVVAVGVVAAVAVALASALS